MRSLARTPAPITAALVLVVGLASAPSATASTGLSIPPNAPATFEAGGTGIPISVTVVNTSTPPESTGSLTLSDITLIPSCGASTGAGDPECAVGRDPGVFALSSAGMGATGTACAGQVFTVGPTGPNGKVRLAAGVPVVLGPPAPGDSDSCRIDLTVDVLRTPTDADPSRPGLQTWQLTFASGTSDVNQTVATARGSDLLTIHPPPPPLPSGGATSTSITTVRGEQPGTLPPSAPATPSARLRGPSGCPSSTPFFASVSGSEIESVTFSLDGRRLTTVRNPTSDGRYAARIEARRLRAGSHTLIATVEFTSASGAAPKKLRLRFARCAKRSRKVKPRFTG